MLHFPYSPALLDIVVSLKWPEQINIREKTLLDHSSHLGSIHTQIMVSRVQLEQLPRTPHFFHHYIALSVFYVTLSLIPKLKLKS